MRISGKPPVRFAVLSPSRKIHGVCSFITSTPFGKSREKPLESVESIIAALGTKVIEKNDDDYNKNYDTHDAEDSHPACFAAMAALVFLAFVFVMAKVSNKYVPDVHSVEQHALDKTKWIRFN